MRKACATLWATVVVVGGTCLALSGQRAASATDRLGAAERDLASTVEFAGELSTLRAAVAPALAPQPHPGGLQPRVAAVLQACALPATALSTLTPEAETAVTGPDGSVMAHRRRATLVLQGLTLPGLGKFLASWRSTEPAWVIAGIDLSPSGNAPAGGDLPLRAALVLETVAIDQAAEPPAPTAPNLLGVSH